jgi:hypothetical protein
MLVSRPRAKPGCAKFLLLTRDARQLDVGSFGKRFPKIAEKAGGKGTVFYACRRTVQTVGEESQPLLPQFRGVDTGPGRNQNLVFVKMEAVIRCSVSAMRMGAAVES